MFAMSSPVIACNLSQQVILSSVSMFTSLLAGSCLTTSPWWQLIAVHSAIDWWLSAGWLNCCSPLPLRSFLASGPVEKPYDQDLFSLPDIYIFRSRVSSLLRGAVCLSAWSSLYSFGMEYTKKTPLPEIPPLLSILVVREMCLPSPYDICNIVNMSEYE